MEAEDMEFHGLVQDNVALGVAARANEGRLIVVEASAMYRMAVRPTSALHSIPTACYVEAH